MMDEHRGTKSSYVAALNRGIREEMQKDSSVIVIGEDVGHGNFGVTKDLVQEFGEERVLDTPLSEIAIVESCVGLALTGWKPIAELWFAPMMACAFDGVFMKLGTYQQKYGGGIPFPIVLRAPMGSTGGGGGPEHAGSPEALVMHSPGLKVVLPSSPLDALGLMKSAIRDDGPVIFLEHSALYNYEEIVPDGDHIIPLGKAKVKKEGTDVTIVTYSAMVLKALSAAEKLSEEGISAEVIDLRTLVPLDETTIIDSLKKTNRLVIAHESMKRGGPAGEIAMRIIEKGFNYLDAPIKRVAALNLALPKSPFLEVALIPKDEDIVKAVKEIL